MKPVVFLDLDGVLVDFIGGAFKLHGKSVPLLDVRWGFPEQIGFTGVNDPTFWAGMGHDFWACLEWTPEGKQLLEGIEEFVKPEQIALMTSLCETVGAVEGKVSWVRRNLPAYTRRLFVGPAKHLAAGPGKILVDDYNENVNRFVEHGGRAVMPPRPWNHRIGECDGQGGFDVSSVLDELAKLVS